MQRSDSIKLNFEALEMEKYTNRARKGDDKNGVICLIIMFTAGFMVIKISEMGHFCIFCWQQQKSSCILDKPFKCI